jgi:hypothetical protein
VYVSVKGNDIAQNVIQSGSSVELGESIGSFVRSYSNSGDDEVFI